MFNFFSANKLDIYIPFEEFTHLKGGPATFMLNLKNELQRNGIKPQTNMAKAKSIFFPVEFSLEKLEHFKARNGNIIQRLDGIYYPEKHGEEFVELNKDIKKIYKEFSSFVIFQSDYSKRQCEALFGVFSKHAIIHNGANKEIFFPKSTPLMELGAKTKFITTGNFRNIDMIEPVIMALDEIYQERDLELLVLGPFPNEALKKYLDREYVQYLGKTTDQHKIANFLRSADAFIYSHLNPPCPNSVIEAVSCGLPVIGFDSGSMNELCSFNTDLLAFVSDDIFQNYGQFDYKKLKEKLLLFMRSPREYIKSAVLNSHRYDVKNCVEEYLRVFDEVDK